MFTEDYVEDEWGVIPPPEDEKPRWTWKRVLFLLISLIVIAAFLGSSYLPGVLSWVEQRERPPEPTRTPLPRAYNPAENDFVENKIEAARVDDLDVVIIYL